MPRRDRAVCAAPLRARAAALLPPDVPSACRLRAVRFPIPPGRRPAAWRLLPRATSQPAPLSRTRHRAPVDAPAGSFDFDRTLLRRQPGAQRELCRRGVSGSGALRRGLDPVIHGIADQVRLRGPNIEPALGIHAHAVGLDAHFERSLAEPVRQEFCLPAQAPQPQLRRLQGPWPYGLGRTAGNADGSRPDDVRTGLLSSVNGVAPERFEHGLTTCPGRVSTAGSPCIAAARPLAMAREGSRA